MPIGNSYVHNFETLKRAFRHGTVALLDCQDRRTGNPVVVVAAVSPHGDGTVEMVPLARMFDGNPYEELDPPNPDDPNGYLEEKHVRDEA